MFGEQQFLEEHPRDILPIYSTYFLQSTVLFLYHPKSQEYSWSQIVWNIICKVQKINKSKILSSGWVLDIMKRWGVKDLLEHLRWCYEVCDRQRYINRGIRKKRQDTKMSKLEHYIAIVNPQYRIKMRERKHLTTPMSLGSQSLNTSLNSLTQVRWWGSIILSSPKYDEYVNAMKT